MKKFRLLSGSHAEETIPGDPTSLKLFRTGDVFESNSDLNKLNSHNSRKFEELDGSQVTLARPTNTYTAAELQALAAQALRAEQLAGVVQERQQAEKSNPMSNPNPSLTVSTTSPAPLPMPKTKAEAFARLDQMSVKDLTTFAEEHEIELKGATKREDILKILKQDHLGKQ